MATKQGAGMSSEDVPNVRDPEWVEQLYRLPVDASVGKELFPVMATLLAHVLFVDAAIQGRKT